MKIKRLNVDEWFPNEEAYIQAKNKYVAEYTVYLSGYSRGLFGGWVDGHTENKPEEGLAKWEAMFPRGYVDWRGDNFYMGYEDAKKIEFSLNDTIDKVKKLWDRVDKLEITN